MVVSARLSSLTTLCTRASAKGSPSPKPLINTHDMKNDVNEKLFLFIEEGPIWDALNALKDSHGTRFGAHCALIELVQSSDVDALDEVCATGAAMYLALQLVGQEVFQTTMAKAIRRAIKLDAEDGDLTERDARILGKTLSVSIS